MTVPLATAVQPQSLCAGTLYLNWRCVKGPTYTLLGHASDTPTRIHRREYPCHSADIPSSLRNRPAIRGGCRPTPESSGASCRVACSMLSVLTDMFRSIRSVSSRLSPARAKTRDLTLLNPVVLSLTSSAGKFFMPLGPDASSSPHYSP